MLDRHLPPARRTEIEAELECPPFPLELLHVWTAFQRLSRRRGAGFSINPLSWPEIDAFRRCSGSRLAPWEVGLIEQLDDLFLAEHTKAKD